MTDNPILQLREATVEYDGIEVLQQASLSVLKNDFLGIIGPNGGGKTTLVKVMLGLLPPEGVKSAISETVTKLNPCEWAIYRSIAPSTPSFPSV